MKKLKVKKTSNFFWYIILGIVLIIVSILIAPFWAKIKNANIPWANWGMTLFLFLLAVTLFAYVFKVLIYKLKVKKQHKIVKILTACEFSIMVLVAICCILFGLTNIDVLDFKIPNNLNNHMGTVIVGFTMWIRGFVEIFGAYYYDEKNSNLKNYPVWYLLINIGLISFGPMFIFSSSITDDVLLYIYASLMLVGGVFAIVYGCLSKPIMILEEPSNEEVEKDYTKTTEKIENPNNKIEDTKPLIENNDVKQLEANNENKDNNDDIDVE